MRKGHLTPGGYLRELRRRSQRMTHALGQFSWLFSRSSCRLRKTTRFKGELNALKVNYIVSLIHPNERYDVGSPHRSKIGVVHEHDLLNLEDREIEYILSVLKTTVFLTSSYLNAA